MSLVIRKYRDVDREQCRSLWRELTEKHREIYLDQTIGGEHPEGYFDKYLVTFGHKRLWVAVHVFKVVGLVGLIVEENEAEIEPLIVSKHYRGKGIGRKLIEKAVSEVRKMKVRFLSIKPVARNTETIKFLYKQGFKTLDASNCSWTSQTMFGNKKSAFSDANSTFDNIVRLLFRLCIMEKEKVVSANFYVFVGFCCVFEAVVHFLVIFSELGYVCFYLF